MSNHIQNNMGKQQFIMHYLNNKVHIILTMHWWFAALPVLENGYPHAADDAMYICASFAYWN